MRGKKLVAPESLFEYKEVAIKQIVKHKRLTTKDNIAYKYDG